MYRKILISLYEKSLDLANAGDDVISIIAVTRKSKTGAILVLLAALPPKIGLITTSLAMQIAAFILSGGKIKKWIDDDLNSEIENIKKSVNSIYNGRTTYSNIKS